MIRRSFLKMLMASPLAGLLKKSNPAIGTKRSGIEYLGEDSEVLEPGDRVWIKTLPDTMRHFPQHVEATVLYSTRFGGRNGLINGEIEYEDVYALDVDGRGHNAWYPGSYLMKVLSTTTGTSGGDGYFYTCQCDKYKKHPLLRLRLWKSTCGGATILPLEYFETTGTSGGPPFEYK